MNDLRGRDSLCIALHELVTLGKPAFAQKLSLDVFALADFSVLMFNPLLDDLSASLPIFVEVSGATACLGSSLH